MKSETGETEKKLSPTRDYERSVAINYRRLVVRDFTRAIDTLGDLTLVRATRDNRVRCFRPRCFRALRAERRPCGPSRRFCRGRPSAERRRGEKFRSLGRTLSLFLSLSPSLSLSLSLSLSYLGGIISRCQHIPLGSQSTDFMKAASGLGQRALSAPETESQNR